MERKRRVSARAALVAVVALGTTGTAIAGAGAASAPFFACYDKSTRVIHLSPTGRCDVASQNRLTFGAAGARGVSGLQGPQGPAGANGANGAAGVQGIQGVQGPVGGIGGTGANGAIGGTGAGTTGGTGSPGGLGGTGGTGGLGGTGGTGSAGGPGGTGLIGGTGGTGPAGVNAIVTRSQGEDLTITLGLPSTLTASCPAGAVVTGGGFAGSNEGITSSAPSSSPEGWTVTYATDMAQFTVYALCVTGTRTP